MNLSDIVPWGRRFAEYQAMFALSDADMDGRLLGCGDGPASFNAEATLRGIRVVSADPLYAFPGAAIAERIDRIFPTIMAQMRRNAGHYVWRHFPDPQTLVEARRTAMRLFLEDYDLGRRQGRYAAAALPDLPFADDAFDLGLCSHLLFLYSAHLSLDFHRRAAREMLRVAPEARIFPLLGLDGRPSPHLEPLCADLRGDGFGVEIRAVPYEVQRGGDRFLRIWRRP